VKEIIKNYRNNIKNRIKSLIGNPNEDLEQEVFIKMWRNIGKYKEQGKSNNGLTQLHQTFARFFEVLIYKRIETL
jgi:aspartate/methionine/tyrosine aminotransferase